MARKIGSDGVKTAEAVRKNSIRLFAKHGYNAVSMRMIADSVDMQAAALYQYCASKQQLLVDIMRDHIEAVIEAWAKESRADEGPAEALAHFTRFHISYHIERADDVFISYMELRSLEPEGFKEISALRGRYEAILKAILKRGMDEGVFAITDPHVVAMAIIAMLNGVNTWYRSGGRLSLQKIEDIYIGMVLGSVGCASREDLHV